MHPNHRQRLELLKKFVKSLAVFAVFVATGYVVGVFLVAYYFVPDLTPKYVNGELEYVCGLAALPGLMEGALLGSVAGIIAVAYIAHRVWWTTP